MRENGYKTIGKLHSGGAMENDDGRGGRISGEGLDADLLTAAFEVLKGASDFCGGDEGLAVVTHSRSSSAVS